MEEGIIESQFVFKCLEKSLKELHIQIDNKSEDTNLLKSLCPATWDSLYCWPFTLPGVTLTRPCAEVMKESPDFTPTQLNKVTGNAVRICAENGTWLWGNWTNYNECLEGLGDDVAVPADQVGSVVVAVRWILFLGSILSFVTLSISLFIFYYFKRLRCDRIKVHINFMLSLAIRFVLLVLITEPFIFNRDENYRKVDWICKCVMCALMYATVASINWMFIQGHYLHSRLTTNIFDTGTPFRIYYVIGWGLPLLLIVIWAIVMNIHHQAHCWQKFSQLNYIWILVGPMICALTVNLFFLLNIMRILLTKIQRANTSNDATQCRRAVKATAILFPLLGINNLLFVYNPGGGYENIYMLSNTIIQSSQGIFVSFLYCFCSSDVRDALRREYRRFRVRHFAHSSHRQSSRPRSLVVFLAPEKSRSPKSTNAKESQIEVNSVPETSNFNTSRETRSLSSTATHSSAKMNSRRDVIFKFSEI